MNLYKQSARVQFAKMFADGAHCAMKQKRKGTGEDYITHPIAVLRVLEQAEGVTDPMRCAALLHDTIEDTGVTRDDVQARFGMETAQLVDEVTDIARPEDGVRAVRANINRAHLANATADGQTIKLADILANCMEVHHLSPSFAAIWLPEKLATLAVLTKGDRNLWNQANRAVQAALEQLKEVK